MTFAFAVRVRKRSHAWGLVLLGVVLRIFRYWQDGIRRSHRRLKTTRIRAMMIPVLHYHPASEHFVIATVDIHRRVSFALEVRGSAGLGACPFP